MDYSKTKYINQNFGTICHTEVYLTFSRFEAENFQKNSIKFNLKRNSTPADNLKKIPINFSWVPLIFGPKPRPFNVCPVKIRYSKHSSVLLLCLLRIFTGQTLNMFFLSTYVFFIVFLQ